ncbi:outer membrane lipoprotein-sorting protein [Streptomyces africanus]|uniref:Outer membrane lipoprotein-sorting protein n=2 Tax=Streptomyces africanus TaxID=231024 RepID=A0ABU0R2I7_9ACTN|nr:outer membrane lipoprotein-sorting protein [Streptomyces africanus]
MRAMGTVTTTALACLLAGAALTGCGAGGTGEEKSAGDILDEANATMRKLNSVTVDITNRTTSGGSVTNRLVTDLDSRCRSRTTWSRGGTLEQIRLGETDYVRPDRAYLQKWKNYPGLTGEQKLWVRTPVDPAGRGGGGLASCERPFDSFGTARKGGSTRVEGTKAVELIVTDKADKKGTYTFYVAAEGKPYLLRTVYKSAAQHTTTSFSAFDEPLDIRAPKAGEVLRVPGGN